MILTLQTTTFGAYGGIPTYNRLVCRVLNETAPSEGSVVLIGTDKAADLEAPRNELRKLHLEGFDQKRISIVSRFVALAFTKRIDLALIGHVNYAPLGWLLKRLQPRMRYGVMLYGIEAWKQLPRFKRHALRGADFLISISEYTKQRAVEANDLNPDLIYLLPNALEWDDQVPESITGPSSVSRTELLSVCRLDETERYKGVDKVIEALPQVALRVPGIHYSVVGGGTDLERHKQLAKKLGVAERVDFLGFLSDDDLRACYRDCDVFVMPSAGEGFGFVFLEAMKCAKPIVAANSGGAPEVVQDGVTGRLVDYGDKGQLEQTLVDLLANADERRRLGQAGHQRLQEKFTYTHFSKALMEILQCQLLSPVDK